ncbi:MAG TPA: hypothetical protein VGP47_07815 [Parachlamydiaceae bacterium]|nr:hypothetical protein [Parachlamydiaceae bacterium]
MSKNIVLLAITACILGGCATSYQKYDDTFFIGSRQGYTDSQIDEENFSVGFIGNDVTSYDVVYAHALRRAAEVASEHGFPYFEVVNRLDSSRKQDRNAGYIVYSVTIPAITLQIKGLHYQTANSYNSY